MTILLLEDDATFSLMLSTWLRRKGLQVKTSSTIAEARQKLSTEVFNLILSDLYLPDGNGIEQLKWLKERNITTPIIMMTNFAQIQTAVQAIKLGASDYVSKPVNQEELWTKISEVLYKDSPKSLIEGSLSDLMEGSSPVAKQMYGHVALVAPTAMSVLITGSSGTGKESIARRIHDNSDRRKGAFVAVDCGAIPKELAASEFFGHVKGSFTGAIDNKTGAFEAAHGGTIFLDEIGNLSYELQVHLLRVLQERAVKPIGSNQLIKTDVRLISATNENLKKAISEGHFREDLFHRINEFTIKVPNLVERREDIMMFAEYFLKQSNTELQKNVKGFDRETKQIFLAHTWPGNLRQMKNVVKYATLLSTDDYIMVKDLPDEMSNGDTVYASTLKDKAHDKEVILRALQDAENNKTLAARILGIDRKTLYNKMKAYGMEM